MNRYESFVMEDRLGDKITVNPSKTHIHVIFEENKHQSSMILGGADARALAAALGSMAEGMLS